MNAKLTVSCLALVLGVGCGVAPEDAAGSLRKGSKVRPKAQVKPVEPERKRIKPKLRKMDVTQAVKGLGQLDQVRVPVFADSVKPGEKAKLVARLDQALTDMKSEKGVPKDVLRGVAVWESLSEKERLGLLSGEYGQVAAIPTWAVAAVGAAHLTYEVGKDYNWWASAREKLTLQQFKGSDLDYVESKLGIEAKGNISRQQIADTVKSLGNLKGAKVPVFKDGVSAGERKKLIAGIDQAIKELKSSKSKLSPDIANGVRVWEQLSPKQRLDMLTGQFGHAQVNFVYVVTSATVTQITQGDHTATKATFEAGSERFQMVSMSGKDLDYINKNLASSSKMPSPLVVADAIEHAGDLKAAKIPVFKDSLDKGARAKLAGRIDQAIQDMRADVATLPTDVQDGVRIWESLEVSQREQMLGGKLGQVAAVPTWAVAAVGAAKLVYDVGKDQNWWGSSREQLDMKTMSAKELDYISR